jgi:hypothetical protein
MTAGALPAFSAVRCGKIRYFTHRRARKVAEQMNRQRFPGFRGNFMAAYYCPVCSGEAAVWHVTRKEQRGQS